MDVLLYLAPESSKTLLTGVVAPVHSSVCRPLPGVAGMREQLGSEDETAGNSRACAQGPSPDNFKYVLW